MFFFCRFVGAGNVRMKVMKRGRAVRLSVLPGTFVIIGILCLLATYPTKEEWLRAHARQLAHLKITPEMIAKAAPWQKSFET
jgi:hypothetical protein